MNQTHLNELHQSGATAGQVVTWDAGLNHYTPQTPAAGGGGGTSSAARVYRTTNQTIPDVTYTKILFDAENYDTDGIHDNVTNSGRLTCKVAGKYVIQGNIGMVSGSTDREARIVLNGGTIISIIDNIQSSAISIPIDTQYELAVNDYIEIELFQDSGTTKDVFNGQGNTWFAMSSAGGAGLGYSEDTMGDADKTWTVGRSTMRLTANFTAVRTLTLPAANSLVAGSVIFLQAQFGTITQTNYLFLQGAGADTINGASTNAFQPQGTNNFYVTPRILIFVTDGVSKWLCKGINEYTSHINLSRTHTAVVLAANTNRMPATFNDAQVIITFNLASDDGETATGTVLVDNLGDLVFQTIATVQNVFNVTGIGIGGSLTIKQVVTFICPLSSNYKWVAAGSGTTTVTNIYEILL